MTSAKNNLDKSQAGFSLILTLLILAGMLAATLAISEMVFRVTRSVGNASNSEMAYYGAETAAEKTLYQINKEYKSIDDQITLKGDIDKDEILVASTEAGYQLDRIKVRRGCLTGGGVSNCLYVRGDDDSTLTPAFKGTLRPGDSYELAMDVNINGSYSANIKLSGAALAESQLVDLIIEKNDAGSVGTPIEDKIIDGSKFEAEGDYDDGYPVSTATNFHKIRIVNNAPAGSEPVLNYEIQGAPIVELRIWTTGKFHKTERQVITRLSKWQIYSADGTPIITDNRAEIVDDTMENIEAVDGEGSRDIDNPSGFNPEEVYDGDGEYIDDCGGCDGGYICDDGECVEDIESDEDEANLCEDGAVACKLVFVTGKKPTFCPEGYTRCVFSMDDNGMTAGKISVKLTDSGGVSITETGIPAADIICQSLAEEAGLHGEFRAWLSDSGHDARDRFPYVNYARSDSDYIPYYLVGGDGPLLVNDPGSFFGFGLDHVVLSHGINIDSLENNLPLGAILGNINDNKYFVFTGTGYNGEKYSNPAYGFTTLFCDDWKSASNEFKAETGYIGGKNGYWTQQEIHELADGCNIPKHLYCFEK